MNRRARALFLVALLLWAAPALASVEEDEEFPDGAPPFPTEAQAAGIRAALDNPDPAVQREAFRILARTGWAHHPGDAQNEVHVTPAEAAARLDDPDPDVCRAAVTLLGNMGLSASSPAADKIVAFRADRRPAVAKAAARSLRQLESPATARESPPAPSLDEALRWLSGEDSSKWMAAAEALVMRRGETREIAQAAAPAFSSAGRGPTSPILAGLLRRAPSPPGTLPAELAALLRHADAGVRHTALETLVQVPEWLAKHAGEINPLLGDADPEVRAETALALSHGRGTAPVARALGACLADPEARVRAGAAEALGFSGPAAATPFLPALVALLSDPEPDVRLGAVRALSFLDEADSHAEEIIALLGTRPSGGVVVNRDAVSAALMRLKEAPPAALRALAARCTDADPEVRVLALEVLGSLSAGAVDKAMDAAGRTAAGGKPDFSRWSGGPAAACAPVVAARLDDPDRAVRCAALETLGMMGREGGAYARQAAARLRDRDPEMRCDALRALGRMGAMALPFAREIAERRRDPVPGVRAEAARTLGLLPGGLESLVLDFTRDPVAEVRHAALGSLDEASLALPSVAMAILARLEDRDEGVRSAAESQLGSLARHRPAFLAHFAARLSNPRPAARQAVVQRLDALAHEMAEAGPARDFLVAVLRVLPGLADEERARLRAHLHVWTGKFFQGDRPDLQPAVAWLGRPQRTPAASSLDADDVHEALVAFREVWDGTEAKRDAALRRETAQRAAELATALTVAPDEETAKALGEWAARLEPHAEFKACRQAIEEAMARRSVVP